MALKGNVMVRIFTATMQLLVVTLAETTEATFKGGPRKGKKYHPEVSSSKVYIFMAKEDALNLYKALKASKVENINSIFAKLTAKLGEKEALSATLTVGGKQAPVTLSNNVGYHSLMAEVLRSARAAGQVDLVDEAAELAVE